MNCPLCGAEQISDGRFCSRCGTKLLATKTGAIPPPDSFPVPVPDTAEPQPEAPQAAAESFDPVPVQAEALMGSSAARRKKMGSLVVLVMGLLVIALIWGVEKHPPLPSPTPPPAPEVKPLPPPPPVIDEATRATRGKIAVILNALALYSSKNKGALPHSLLDLNRGYANPEITRDGWGGNIYYLVDLVHKTFVLRSPGPDGMRETADDIVVANEDAETWQESHEQAISEWQAANPSLVQQMTSVGSSLDEMKKLEAARKAEEEKKKLAALASQEEVRRLEDEKAKQEAARLEAERQRQSEAARHEEELRQAHAREEALRQQQASLQAMNVRENFTEGLARWNAPDSWEIIQDKNSTVLKVQGLGLLKPGQDWENYQVEFEIKINKEAGGWLLRAGDRRNFYVFKLASEKAQAIPKNSLVKYVFADGKYLNSLKREDAPGAAGVVALPTKIRLKEYYRIRAVVKGNTITHFFNGTQVDSWTDDTFARGRFGFNASAIESVLIRQVTIQPVD